MKFKKKPVVIEAIQLLDNDKSINQVQKFIENKVPSNEATSIRTSIMDMDWWDKYLDIVRKDGGIRLKTMESDNETQIASFGDWVIKGIAGEFYPCKNEIFLKTYEPVDSSIQEGEERMFTLEEALEIWEASGEWEYRKNSGSVPTTALNKQEYFKDKFGIDLENINH
jgi:hypothetical protein